MSRSYTTGQLATEAGVHVETIRYYERTGLLSQPGRRPSGYRNYTAADLERLRAIVLLKGYGFKLKEIQQLLAEFNEPDLTCGDLQQRFQSKLVELQAEIQQLQDRCRTIERAMAICQPDTAITSCPQVLELGAKCAAHGERPASPDS